MSKEHYLLHFSDRFTNREQESRIREVMIVRAQEASVPLTTPADISPVNTGHSEKPSGRVLKFLGPLVVPLLIAACSTPSQPQARQIESSPTVPISTPTMLPTREATSTPNLPVTPEKCDPVEFAKKQGVPTPYPRGGEEEAVTDELTIRVVEISKKLGRCESLTPEEAAILVKYNLEYDVKPPVSVPVAKPAVTSIPEKSPEERKMETLALTDKIISEIKNPPKEVMEKYGLTLDDLQEDNMVLIYGSDPKVLKETTGKNYVPDRSLLGVKEWIEKGDNNKALGVLKDVLMITRNGAIGHGEGKSAPRARTNKTNAELDPKRVIVRPNAPPDVHQIMPVHRVAVIEEMHALANELR